MFRWTLALKGVAMGIAEAIPGVSGGTIAFISGIYEELLSTIRSIHPANLRILFKKPRAFWLAINGPFLSTLLIGMALGLSFGVILISALLTTHKHLLWSLFFGVVLSSVVYMSRDIQWNIRAILIGLIFAILSYWLTILEPGQGSGQLWYFFLAGVVAISALMLPGVSGSFMLLLLGLYDTVIHAVKNTLTTLNPGKDLSMLVLFSLGLITGLFSFARVLGFLFRKYHNQTMAAMIGVLLGSLSKLWPYKLIENVIDMETGEIIHIGRVFLEEPAKYKILTETNIGPAKYSMEADPQIVFSVLLVVFGFGLVGWLMSRDPARNIQD